MIETLAPPEPLPDPAVETEEHAGATLKKMPISPQEYWTTKALLTLPDGSSVPVQVYLPAIRKKEGGEADMICSVLQEMKTELVLVLTDAKKMWERLCIGIHGKGSPYLPPSVTTYGISFIDCHVRAFVLPDDPRNPSCEVLSHIHHFPCNADVPSNIANELRLAMGNALMMWQKQIREKKKAETLQETLPPAAPRNAQ